MFCIPSCFETTYLLKNESSWMDICLQWLCATERSWMIKWKKSFVPLLLMVTLPIVPNPLFSVHWDRMRQRITLYIVSSLKVHSLEKRKKKVTMRTWETYSQAFCLPFKLEIHSAIFQEVSYGTEEVTDLKEYNVMWLSSTLYFLALTLVSGRLWVYQ